PDPMPETDACTEPPESQSLPETEADSAQMLRAHAQQPHPEPLVVVQDGYDRGHVLTVNGQAGTYTVSLREYLIGVVMAEMPSYFHAEALRAQAIAARSYLLYRAERGFGIYDWGSSCTAHFSEEEGRAFFGDAYADAVFAAAAAVDDTDGQVLFYGGRVCCAAYHAMSYRCTERGDAVWGGDTPYLVSVPTCEDEAIAGMMTEVMYDEDTLCRLLGADAVLPLQLSYTEAGRVSQVQTASGDTFSGEALRSALRLRSTVISVTQEQAGAAVFRVYGFGHGVGMSQYGADAYADAGWSYADILAHYYPGTDLVLLS
ncbi:MAG: SpoIID/LytB domain-containing protein, partial [Clostridia bacterium]|nr:SpoIID/LytB domain-containing protein [Clostridia bacterium]